MMSARVVVCFVLGLFALPRVASAEPVRSEGAAHEPTGYKAAIESGIDEFAHDNFTEAREQFGRAHGLFPNARTLRGLGMTEFELRNYVDSVRLLEQALASDVKRLDGKLRAETETLLARAQGYVGMVRLRIQPASAAVTVDGVASDVGALGTLRLGVGDHLLEFRADGRLTERRAIKLKGQETQAIALTLAEPGQASSSTSGPTDAAPTASAEQSERRPVYKQWWLWTTIGVVVAGAAVGGVLYANANRKEEMQSVKTANTPAGVELQPLWRH